MKLKEWTFRLEDDNGREITIEGRPLYGSFEQWGATSEELCYTMPLCRALIETAKEECLTDDEEEEAE